MGVMSVAVIGAGASGIAAAYYLRKRGYEVVMFECLPSIGGRMATAELGGRKIAIGGKNIGRDTELFREFVRDHGNASFEDHGMGIVRQVGGRLLPLPPKSFIDLWHTAVACGVRDLAKFSAYYRLLRRANGKNDFLGNDDFVDVAEKSDHRPLTSYFGKKFNDYFLRLLTVRTSGAEPDSCYLGNLCASLGTGASRGMEQLANDGLADTMRAFEDSNEIEILKNVFVTSVVERRGKYSVLAGEGLAATSREFDAVIVAVPASAAGPMLVDIWPDATRAFNKMTYNPTAIAVVKYSEPVFGASFRGIAFSPEERLFNASAYGMNDLDIVRYTFSGRAAMASINGHTEPEVLVTYAEGLLSQYCKHVSSTRQTYAYRYFEQGHCSYAPYHHRVVNEIQGQLAAHAIEVTGDYIKGSSIEACFMASKVAVTRLCDKLRSV